LGIDSPQEGIFLFAASRPTRRSQSTATLSLDTKANIHFYLVPILRMCGVFLYWLFRLYYMVI